MAGASRWLEARLPGVARLNMVDIRTSAATSAARPANRRLVALRMFGGAPFPLSNAATTMWGTRADPGAVGPGADQSGRGSAPGAVRGDGGQAVAGPSHRTFALRITRLIRKHGPAGSFEVGSR